MVVELSVCDTWGQSKISDEILTQTPATSKTTRHDNRYAGPGEGHGV